MACQAISPKRRLWHRWVKKHPNAWRVRAEGARNPSPLSFCAEHTDGKAVPNGGAYSNFDFGRMSREIVKIQSILTVLHQIQRILEQLIFFNFGGFLDDTSSKLTPSSPKDAEVLRCVMLHRSIVVAVIVVIALSTMDQPSDQSNGLLRSQILTQPSQTQAR